MRRCDHPDAGVILPLALLAAFAFGCAETVTDTDTAADTVADKDLDSTPAHALDPLDQKPLGQLKAAWDGLAASPIWPDYPLATSPAVLIHRAGAATHALMLRWPEAPAEGVQIAAPDLGTDVWWTAEHLDAILPAQVAAGGVTISGHLAIVAAFDPTSFKPPWEWLGVVARETFVRMQQLDQGWKTVEGCGLAKYPRKQDLIALTLLEDALLAEILAADSVALGELAKDLVALRAARIAIDPYTRRIDHDAANVNGAPRYAELMVPVLAGLRDQSAVQELLAEELGLSMALAVSELDDQLLWKRPLTGAIVTLQLARRLKWAVADTFQQGKSVYDVAVANLGEGDASRLPAIKARHDFAAMNKRAGELMQL